MQSMLERFRLNRRLKLALIVVSTSIIVACVQSETPRSPQTSENLTNNTTQIIDRPAKIDPRIPVEIYVAETDPENLKARFARSSRVDVIRFLYEELKPVQSQPLRGRSSSSTVIYAIFGELPIGTRVTTRWTVERSSMNKPFTEEYDYIISESDDQVPLIILNELYNENPGTFTFELLIDGKNRASTSRQYVAGSF